LKPNWDLSLPRHSRRSRSGILDCLLVQSSQQHGCLCGKIAKSKSSLQAAIVSHSTLFYFSSYIPESARIKVIYDFDFARHKAYRMANFTQANRSAPHHMLLHVGLGSLQAAIVSHSTLFYFSSYIPESARIKVILPQRQPCCPPEVMTLTSQGTKPTAWLILLKPIVRHLITCFYTHAVGFVPCEVKVITSGGDCESLDLILFQLLYPRVANFTQANRSAPHHMLLHVGLGRIAWS
jgi:hypothetical protein